MIAVFLPSYPFRGNVAPYLWFFYRLITTVKEPIHFILGKEYLYPIDYWESQHRWEIDEASQQRLGYTLPTETSFENCKYTCLNEKLFYKEMGNSNNNPTEFFRKFLTEEVTDLRVELEAILSQLPYIDTILSWSNCPSLKMAAEKYNIPVMHLELGPLRHPDYLSTGYLDFSGVNGNTEAKKRYFKVADECKLEYSLDTLMKYFFQRDELPIPSHECDLGIVLQVENDSNLIAFGNNFNNQSLLDYTAVNYHNKKIVRPHPGSSFLANKKIFDVDDSPSSIHFIAKCNEIITINSSVGLEALLMNIPVKILGDCSFSFINETDDLAERFNRLAFYLFAYLVPFDLLFDFNYLRFRLSEPKEIEIIRRHIEFYREEKKGGGHE